MDNGNPFLVVLDEPNSNLDSMGDAALFEAIRSLRARKAIVIVISHRSNILAELDTVLVLNNGQVLEFGRRDEVWATLTKRMGNIKHSSSEGQPGRPGREGHDRQQLT